jgi:amino acid efflux transporter
MSETPWPAQLTTTRGAALYIGALLGPGLLLLVALLVLVVLVAVAGSVHSSRAGNWAPFAPHGWGAVGHAASTLMLSFVGWEAAAPLTTRFADPGRQLPRVIGIALAVTSVLYLGLAVAVVGVLGTGAGASAPLAALLRDAAGPAGTAAAAVAAVVLTLGAVNAYVTGAAAMTRELAGSSAGLDAGTRPAPRFIAAVAATGAAVIGLYGAGLVSPGALVGVPTTLFLAVYLGCMVAAARVLRGRARWAAVPAAVIVTVVLGYCGWALLAPVAVLLASSGRRRRGSRVLPGSSRPKRLMPRREHCRVQGDTCADSGMHLECQTLGVA